MDIIHSIHAAGDDINESFNRIEREYQLERQLEREREEHQRTREALNVEKKAVQQIVSERQIEITLQNHPDLLPEARPMVTKLLLMGQGGELELDSKGRLREKTGVRDLAEVAADFLKENSNFLGSGNSKSASPTPKLNRATMTPMQKARYIDAHGKEKYLALPFIKDAKK